MTYQNNETTQTLFDNFVFTKSFDFTTPVPIDLCAERLGDLPFQDGNTSYTVEIEPRGDDYAFTLWVGNKHQNTRQKGRVISTGWMTQQGNETLVRGEVKIGTNRMLMLSILTIVTGFWTFGMFTDPYLFFMSIVYTGGILIIAPLYLFWQTLKERNKMVKNIEGAVTPYLSDRRSRLQDQHQNPNQAYNQSSNQQIRRRQ